MSDYISMSEEDTYLLGDYIAKMLRPGDILSITGGIGAGKTALTRGIITALGYMGRVTSPTYSIVNEYKFDGHRICHFDLYRLGNDSIMDIGFYEYFDADSIVIIEWLENIDFEKKPTYEIDIRIDGFKRNISIRSFV